MEHTKSTNTNVTIKDVARTAGVSIATVSRILNGSAGVSEELAARVNAAVDMLEYRPNAVARALKERKSRSIGLVIPDIENPFFPSLVRGAEDAARQQGYAVILCNTDGNAVEEDRYIQFLFSKQVDGILFIGGIESQGNLEMLADLPVPVVTLDRRAATGKLSAVVYDNYQGAILAVEHLIKTGRKKIAFISGPLKSSSSIDRRRGFTDTLAKFSLPVNEKLTFVGNYSFDSGYQAAKELIEKKESFDAIFAANDMMAIGAIEALLEASIRVPEDVAIVGFDDIRLAFWHKPSLTTVRQPAYEMGQAAVAMLIKQMSSISAEVLEHKFLPELIVRKSTENQGAEHEPKTIRE